jgi:hypothetical protein
MAGILSTWGLDKALLSICAAGICKLVLAEAVRDEVEENLLLHADNLSRAAAHALLDNYHCLVELLDPELIPYARKDSVQSSRHLIRHAADVPVLLAAIAAKPDWLITRNTKHFDRSVGARTGLRIATPSEFFRALASGLK